MTTSNPPSTWVSASASRATSDGLVGCGPTVQDAWNLMYWLETACKVQIDVLASGVEISLPSHELASAMAKRYVTDTCFDVADQALQLHGGYGYLREYGLEKIVRDLRVHRILEGTNEIMRVVIGRAEAARARASA